MKGFQSKMEPEDMKWRMPRMPPEKNGPSELRDRFPVNAQFTEDLDLSPPDQ